MYQEARKEKLMEIKRLMQELMAEEGADAELSDEALEETLDEASEESEKSLTEMAMGDDEEEDPEEEFKRKRREFFQPKKKAPDSLPSKIVIASTEIDAPRLSKAIPDYKSSKRMKA